MRGQMTGRALAAGMAMMFAVFASTTFAGTGDGDASTRIYLSAAVERIYLSAQLASAGHGQRDPILLVASARLLAWGHPYARLMSPEISGGAADAAKAPAQVEHTPQTQLTEAHALAGTDTAMLGVIEASRLWIDEEIERVGTGGPYVHKQTLQRGARAKFRLKFFGHEPARVAVVGSLARADFLLTTKINLVVLDEKGTVVCESRNWEDFEFCQWKPQQDTYYSLMVENNGKWANQFAIYTN